MKWSIELYVRCVLKWYVYVGVSVYLGVDLCQKKPCHKELITNAFYIMKVNA